MHLEIASGAGLLLLILNPATRILGLLLAEAGAMLLALIHIEQGDSYLAWNIVAIAAAVAFGLDRRRLAPRLPRRERYAMRCLFGESLPQLLFRDNTRTTFRRHKEATE